ncbi:arylsulfatase A-like enzyme [Sinorhizobium terangae]|uniref:Sulfatase-like hydrolase/transferase n=2 Tax=Sinorhizobium terangae TaxID=110322 RepID=A0A6N7LFM5_SINTE|nr:arylsulfatase A-like enzyme [Sinorhizobium terangae]MQX15715.1 sulfatase-like hydrolase/transferase [Sinorhizobium terangae]
MYHALARELARLERLMHNDLRRAVFRCGFVGKWHVGVEKGPGDYGFEGNAPAGYGNIVKTKAFKDYLSSNNLSYRIEPELYFNPDQQTMAASRWSGPQASTPCYFLTDQIIGMLQDLAGGSDPFFATVQYWDPHGPHLISDEFYGVTDRTKIAPWSNFSDDLSASRGALSASDDFYRNHPRTKEELVGYIGYYCDLMTMLDHEIGRLLDYVDRSGLAKDTLVVFTSDRGDMTGAHGMAGSSIKVCPITGPCGCPWSSAIHRCKAAGGTAWYSIWTSCRRPCRCSASVTRLGRRRTCLRRYLGKASRQGLSARRVSRPAFPLFPAHPRVARQLQIYLLAR